MKHDFTTLISQLKNIANNTDSLQQAVAQELLDSYPTNTNDIEVFFKDLLSFGCLYGTIGSLVYRKQTHAFFDRHYDEIEDLRIEFQESTSECLPIKYDLKNELAWYAFETTAQKLAEKLGFDV